MIVFLSTPADRIKRVRKCYFLFLMLIRAIYGHSLMSQMVYSSKPPVVSISKSPSSDPPLTSHLHIYFFIIFLNDMPVLHFLAFPFSGIIYCLPSMENVMLKGWVTFCEHLGLSGNRLNHEPSDAFPRQVSSMPGMGS